MLSREVFIKLLRQLEVDANTTPATDNEVVGPLSFCLSPLAAGLRRVAAPSPSAFS